MDDKPVKYSVAAVVRRGDHRFLAVRRPPDDDPLPDVWGLPAVTLEPGESVEDAVRRIGREKLSTEIEPIRLLGSKEAIRRNHRLVLTDFEARLLGGEPEVRASRSPATRYVEQKWTDRLDLLIPAASQGSLCCQILLDEAGVSYRDP